MAKHGAKMFLLVTRSQEDVEIAKLGGKFDIEGGQDVVGSGDDLPDGIGIIEVGYCCTQVEIGGHGGEVADAAVG